MLIPFPLLWKLQVNQRQKMILVAIFLLPTIPIIFGVLRLVFVDPTNGPVDVIKFTFYSMLENTAGKPQYSQQLRFQPDRSSSNHHSLPSLLPSLRHTARCDDQAFPTLLLWWQIWYFEEADHIREWVW